MTFLKSLRQSFARHFINRRESHFSSFPPSSSFPSDPATLPPKWQPAPEQSHIDGLYSDASDYEYQTAERWCIAHQPELPRLLPSDAIDQIRQFGCRAWGLDLPPVDFYQPRFQGAIENLNLEDNNIPRIRGRHPGNEEGKDVSKNIVRVSTTGSCKDVSLLSNFPIVGGLYDVVGGKEGVYFEVLVERMEGVIAIGTACRPYPSWRLPGWNRLSAGLHLDDFCKFFEDPDGGRDYLQHPPLFQSGDIIGCGYVLKTGTLFFTCNGQRLPDAFTGIYLPRRVHDVYAAIGVGGLCTFQVNFGGEPFRWSEGDLWAWKIEGHVGVLDSGARMEDGDTLPSYQEIARPSS